MEKYLVAAMKKLTQLNTDIWSLVKRGKKGGFRVNYREAVSEDL
jgi:hypothetical protein